MERYRRTLQRHPDAWKLQSDLAQSLYWMEDYVEAMHTLQDLIQSNEGLLQSDEDYKRIYWDTLLPQLGFWNLKLKDYGAAEAAYRKVLDHSFQQTDFDLPGKLAAEYIVSALNYQRKYSDTIELLSRLSTINNSDGISWLVLLFQYTSTVSAFHNQLSIAAKRTQLIPTIIEYYKHAIEVTESKDMEFELLGELLSLKQVSGQSTLVHRLSARCRCGARSVATSC